jgi:RNA polymerase sigma-54 factor
MSTASTPKQPPKSGKGQGSNQGPHLALRQMQSLVMTPALKQAIALLQMTNLELDALIEQEIQTNPFLERADGSAPDTGSMDPVGTSDDTPTLREQEYHALNNYAAPDEKTTIETPHDDKLEFDTSNVFTGDSEAPDAYAFENSSKGATRDAFDDVEMSFENRLSREDSLFDHLARQIQMDFSAPQDRMIATSLMEGLDEAGYFRGSTVEIAKKFDCEIADIEMVLARCQGFDPSGIFACNLAQCLEIQLREMGELTPVMQVMLANLHYLEKHDFKTLQKKCGVDEPILKNMIISLRRLDPKPGAKFNHDVAQTLIPDIIMRKSRDTNSGDSWMVELNNDTLPRVLINQRYAALVTTGKMKKEEKTYLIERYQGAQFLIKAMDQRAQTIIKVAAEIVRQQESFFAYGVSYLKPLVLRDIAAQIEVHESTVSRVTTGKYMITPRGIFELKYFFSSGLGGQENGDTGMAHSSNAIKARIKELIDAEEPMAILSDDELSDLLKKENIPVARRTVMKYREALGLGSSVERRRQKRLS